ncbi:MAG: GNAT family N-acetyltransferase [Gemmatimonadota bacterium]|nr:GNAT family N-acetyltransferase [Gemmatimonadota bacterium]
MPENALMQRALEVFAHGYSFTRSFTHPYPASREGAIWVVRDAPRKRGTYRREEWIAHGVDAEEIHRVALENTQGQYGICAICAEGESDAGMRADFKALNYRLNSTEPVMVHRLRRIPRLTDPLPIERVLRAEMADRLNRTTRIRQILPEHLVPDAPLRQYVALENEQPVGWVQAIVVDSATWCSNMFVTQAARRRGIGRALMCRMLRDDRSHGSELAVLTATHTGALLYSSIGYVRIGTLLFYTPKKR